MDSSARRTRYSLTLVAAMTALASLSACGGGSTAAEAPAVDVQLGRFVIIPDELTVPAGTASLRVTNVDNMVHNLVVAGRGTQALAPGATQTIQIETKPGDYRMWCDMQGHAAMGQIGTLHSEAVAASTTAPAATP